MGKYFGAALTGGFAYLSSRGNFAATAFAVYGALTTKAPEGQKLDKLSVQTAGPGEVIPHFYGTTRTVGNIVWSKKLRHKKKKGGKGGPRKPTTNKYYWTGAILVGQQCDQIMEIWANNKKIYDYNDGDQQGFDMDFDPATGTWSHDKLRIYTGTKTQMPDPVMEADLGVGNCPAYRGRTLVVFDDISLEDYGMQIPTFSFVVRRAKVLIKDIALELCGLVGIAPEDCDFSAFGTSPLSGFIINSRSECRQYLTMLETVSESKISEYDYKIRAKNIDDLTLVVLRTEDVQFADSGQERVFTEGASSDPTDIANRIEIEYLDSGRNYNKNTQGFSRQVVSSREKDVVSYPMVFNGAQARRLAQVELVTRWTERKRYTLTMGLAGLFLVPGDILRLPLALGAVDVRIEQITKQFFGPVMIQAVLHDSAAYGQPVIVISNDLEPTLVTYYPLPNIKIFETSPLTDIAANGLGFYVAAGMPINGSFSDVTFSSDSIQTIEVESNDRAVTLSDACPIGSLVSLADVINPHNALDKMSALIVDIQNDTLESSSIDNMLVSNDNVALLGKELIQFGSVALISQSNGINRYQLTNLIRGIKGTENYINGHIAGEDFIVLENVKWVQLAISDAGREIDYSIAWGDSEEESTSEINYSCQGENLRTFAPLIADIIQSTQGIQIFWQKRTRYNDFWIDTGFAAVDSNPPDLDIFLLRVLDTNGNELRNLQLTNENWLYTKAMIDNDLPNLNNSVREFNFEVSRLSAVSTPSSPDAYGHLAIRTVILDASYFS